MPLPVSMDATWLDGSVQFNGQELRRADASLWTGEGSTPLGVWGGITRHSDTSLAVTVNASDLITIQPGACVIAGNAGVGNGAYRTALGAAETGQLAARSATNPRIDRVIYRVLDTSVVGSHGAYTGRIEVLTGVPAASPAVPALPTLAIELARITVPATGGGVATVDSTWRPYAAAIGGILPVATAARLPATPNAKWLKAVAIDTGVEYFWNGVSWQADGTWLAFGVSITPDTGAFNNANANGRYTVMGRTLICMIQGFVIDVGSGGGSLKFSLPVNVRTGGPIFVGAGRETQATGATLLATILNANTVSVNNFPMVSGRTAHIQVICEIA